MAHAYKEVTGFIRGEPKRALDIRETYGNFAKPMNGSMYMYVVSTRLSYMCKVLDGKDRNDADARITRV